MVKNRNKINAGENMLHMILGILKILGFLILFLILMFLSLLLAALFVPIRYRASGSIQENISITFGISWMFRLISFVGELKGKKIQWSVRIFGYPFLKSEREKSSGPEAERKSDRKTDRSTENHENKNSPGNWKPTVIERPQSKEQTVTEEKSDEHVREKNESEETVSPLDTSEKTESVYSKNSEKYASEEPEKEKQFRMPESLKTIKKHVSDLRMKKDRLMHFWNRNATGKTIEHGKKELCYLLRHISPRDFRGKIRFGLEDPAVTGQILGVLCVLQAFSGNHLEAEADFEKKVLEGMFSLKGHIRTCHFVGVFLRMLLDKHVRITVKGIRTLQL